MSEIKERDILKLLDGRASPKKLRKLKKWTDDSPKNGTAIEQYQTIFDESKELSSYNKVNVNSEWAQFQNAVQQSVSEGDLLNYFDGLADASERKKVEQWRDFSKSNTEEFETFDMILSESAGLADYKTVNPDQEWASFLATTKKSTHLPLQEHTSVHEKLKETKRATTYVAPNVITPPPTGSIGAKEVTFTPVEASAPVYSESERSNSAFMWRSLAAAAAILLLCTFAWNVWQNSRSSSLSSDDLFVTYATADMPETLTISDGTMISLDEQTKLTYFRDVDQVNDRTVTLDGRGTFDVTSNQDKPFIVKARRSGVGIRVLGTRFRFEKSDIYVEVIENIEGSVRAYSLSDTNTYVIMTAGDRYGFDGEKFINLKDAEEPFNGATYNIQYVLDFLMKESDWRVITKAYSDFDGESDVIIDLAKDYEDVLEDLSRQANFEYIELDCDGCYMITKFLPLSQ